MEVKSVEDIKKCTMPECLEGSKEIFLTGLSDPDYFIYPNDSLKCYYYEGDLKQVHVVFEGENHGTFLEFYATGGLRFFGRYRRGENEGMFRIYNENGTINRTNLKINGHIYCGVDDV